LNSFYFANVQSVDLQKTTDIAPDVDHPMQEKPLEETKQSIEGADFYTKEILESQKFLTVSSRYLSTYL